MRTEGYRCHRARCKVRGDQISREALYSVLCPRDTTTSASRCTPDIRHARLCLGSAVSRSRTLSPRSRRVHRATAASPLTCLPGTCLVVWMSVFGADSEMSPFDSCEPREALQSCAQSGSIYASVFASGGDGGVDTKVSMFGRDDAVHLDLRKGQWTGRAKTCIPAFSMTRVQTSVAAWAAMLRLRRRNIEH